MTLQILGVTSTTQSITRSDKIWEEHVFITGRCSSQLHPGWLIRAIKLRLRCEEYKKEAALSSELPVEDGSKYGRVVMKEGSWASASNLCTVLLWTSFTNLSVITFIGGRKSGDCCIEGRNNISTTQNMDVRVRSLDRLCNTRAASCPVYYVISFFSISFFLLGCRLAHAWWLCNFLYSIHETIKLFN